MKSMTPAACLATCAECSARNALAAQPLQFGHRALIAHTSTALPRCTSRLRSSRQACVCATCQAPRALDAMARPHPLRPPGHAESTTRSRYGHPSPAGSLAHRPKGSPQLDPQPNMMRKGWNSC